VWFHPFPTLWRFQKNIGVSSQHISTTTQQHIRPTTSQYLKNFTFKHSFTRTEQGHITAQHHNTTSQHNITTQHQNTTYKLVTVISAFYHSLTMFVLPTKIFGTQEKLKAALITFEVPKTDTQV
jgi:hypothetical protein